MKIQQKGRKKRKHVMMSHDLIGVLSELIDGSESKFVEQAVWEALVDEYGEAQVRAVMEAAQDDLTSDQRLREPKEYALV